MKWSKPPLNKVYEALGSIADSRVEVDGNSAKVYSSSRNKHYEVVYDPDTKTIVSNDNASYWVGYMGYPSIAFILAKGLVKYDTKLLTYLKGFAWKDLNMKFKKFEKTNAYVDEYIVKNYGVNIDRFHEELEGILESIGRLNLHKPSKIKKPPSGY